MMFDSIYVINCPKTKGAPECILSQESITLYSLLCETIEWQNTTAKEENSQQIREDKVCRSTFLYTVKLTFFSGDSRFFELRPFPYSKMIQQNIFFTVNSGNQTITDQTAHAHAYATFLLWAFLSKPGTERCTNKINNLQRCQRYKENCNVTCPWASYRCTKHMYNLQRCKEYKGS